MTGVRLRMRDKVRDKRDKGGVRDERGGVGEQRRKRVEEAGREDGEERGGGRGMNRRDRAKERGIVQIEKNKRYLLCCRQQRMASNRIKLYIIK